MAIYINRSGTAKRMDGAGDGSLYAPVTSIATSENGSTASKAYAVGEMFIRDGKLCTCTVAISSGGTFALGTNYSEGSVGEVLSELNSNTLKATLDRNPIDISQATFENPYITPSDGYVQVFYPYTVEKGKTCAVYIRDSSNTSHFLSYLESDGETNNIITTYVKQGAVLSVNKTNGPVDCLFFPLV